MFSQTITKYQSAIIAIVTSLIFCFTFFYPIYNMIYQWFNSYQYHYASIVPCVSIYMIWSQKNYLRQICLDPCISCSVVFLVPTMLMMILGKASALIAVQQIAILPGISGIILLFLGKSYLRKLWFPIFYLSFMIPIWANFTEKFHFSFQLFSATIADFLLRMFSFPVFHQGVYLELPKMTLEVARACSGVNYLIAVVAVGIAAAQFFIRSWTKRIALVLQAVVIAILANGFRIFLIAVFLHAGIEGAGVHGPYHILIGVFVAAVGYLAIGLGIFVMGKNGKIVSVGDSEVHQDTFKAVGVKQNHYPIKVSQVVIMACMVVTGIYVNNNRFNDIAFARSEKNLPYKISEWEGKDVPCEYDIVNKLGADYLLSRYYRNNKEHQVHVYIAYMNYQDYGKKLIGSNIDQLRQNTGIVNLRFDNHQTVNINRSIQKINGKNYFVYYCFNVGNSMTSNIYYAKLLTAMEGILKNRTNGSIVMFVSKASNDIDRKMQPEWDGKFITQVFPYIREYLQSQ